MAFTHIKQGKATETMKRDTLNKSAVLLLVGFVSAVFLSMIRQFLMHHHVAYFVVCLADDSAYLTHGSNLSDLMLNEGVYKLTVLIEPLQIYGKRMDHSLKEVRVGIQLPFLRFE